MAIYALVNKSGVIENTIIAETTTPLEVFYPDLDAVVATDKTGYPNIGGTYDYRAKKFIDKAPFASWVFDKTAWKWNAPIVYPEDGLQYIWNEQSGSWEIPEVIVVNPEGV